MWAFKIWIYVIAEMIYISYCWTTLFSFEMRETCEHGLSYIFNDRSIWFFSFKDHGLSAVLSSQQNWEESTEICLPSTHTPPIHSFPHYQHLPPEWYICYNWWTYIDMSLSPKVQGWQEGSLLVLYILWVLTNIWWHISTIIISHKTVSLPFKSSVVHLFIPPFPLTAGNHWAYYCPHTFTFSRMLYSWSHILCSIFQLASIS